ncbi:hypothetical protein D3C85_1484340 [compost metagenome]
MRLQQHRNHACLPIVAMNHIRLKIKMRKRLYDTSTEETKALRLIPKAINARPFIIKLIIYKIKSNSFIH